MSFMSFAMTCTSALLGSFAHRPPDIKPLCCARFGYESRSALLAVNSFDAETERNHPPVPGATFRSIVMTSAYTIPRRIQPARHPRRHSQSRCPSFGSRTA